ncbi:hypothetical protein M409DRAFT_67192 [Zasmidium cellare ATCC 36951]|uniref:Major facilitator superfamily (MFS) profile domain-containing protein n=1 Tax=Zasmidium cellare ATCC 36951 TaxID=1080233 RepID=A0A6A6CFA0_ZASCE|nr:uncharacterized protein M409DRAFT_67192 [Zasmidium cellare ATCC 36951]KAF2165323.1 hypothetical protein M409DRAFT_67192 [Zasmidium cellare ATCC 36951]
MSGLRYAFSLSKHEVAEAEPSGTVRLIGTTQITRTPPPSLSPSDPLNWPQWRKTTILLLMSLYCFTANFGSAALAPALQLLLPIYHGTQTFSTLSHLIAVNVLLIGVSNIFWVPLADTFGRRGVLIVAMAVAVGASVWCGQAGSFEGLLAARAVQGVGFGPADSIAASVLGEVFFVHERGRAMTIYTIFLVGGLCGGYIAGIQGYRYIFWITTALLAFVLLGTMFFVAETSFDREAQFLVERESGGLRSGELFGDEKTANVEMIERVSPSSRLNVDRETFTFAQSLRVGVYRGHFLRNFLAPWLSLAFPGTWIVMLHYGGLLGGLVTISIVGPQFLAMPPYLWGNNAGLINIGGLTGCILGGLLNYLLSDRLALRSSKTRSSTQQGFFEPESRLPTIFPFLFLATTGIWTFGFSAQSGTEKAWVGMCVGYAMVGAGITGIPSLGFGYIIDAYHPIAASCFVMTTISRSLVSFAWTYFVGDWVAHAGPAVPFGIFGGIMGVFALLTVPFWWWGKRLRIATQGLLPREE